MLEGSGRQLTLTLPPGLGLTLASFAEKFTQIFLVTSHSLLPLKLGHDRGLITYGILTHIRQRPTSYLYGGGV